MKRRSSDYEEKMKRFHRAYEIQPRLAELEEKCITTLGKNVLVKNTKNTRGFRKNHIVATWKITKNGLLFGNLEHWLV